MKTFTYTVHIEPADEGGFVVSVPALPGCWTQGETYDEALEMAQDAIRGYVESLILDGQPIPAEEPPLQSIDALVQVKTAMAV